MTQEEKAKRYDEALERARAFNNGEDVDVEAGTTFCEYLFPELKESEDERIRKAIMEFFELQDDNTTYSFIPKKDILTWLETQGKHLINYDEAEKEKSDFVGDGFIECHADFLDFKEGNTYWLEYIGDDKYNVRSDNLLGKTYHITPCQLYTIFKKLTWLEKQDIFSKKDVDDAYLKGVTDTKNEIEKQHEANYQIRKDIATFLFNYKGDIKDRAKWMNYLDIKVSFVEPKFKVGDWVIDKQNIVHQIANVIENVIDHTYGYDIVGGGYFNDNTEGVRLWTIQDAKDGDVLSANWHVGANFWERIIIFKKYHSKDVEGLINAPYVEGYGNTFKNGKLIPCAKVPYYSEWTDKLYPATKEQRDLLFQKLKEVGYEWDADKKELKKIDKKLEEKLTIPSLKDFQEAFELKAKQYEIELPNRGYDIYAMCKELYSLLIKPKPTWSEEDEKIRQTIINEFEQCSEWYCSNGLTKEDCINWLNKQKYFEWSDEDNENMNSLFVLLDQVVSINAIGNEHSVEYKNWLKSIKERMGGISYDTRR